MAFPERIGFVGVAVLLVLIPLLMAGIARSPRPAGAAPARVSYVSGGSFEAGAAGWVLAPGARVEEAPGAPHGRRALRVTAGAVSQDLLDLRPGARLTLAASYRTEGVRPTADRGYAFVALYQYDEFGDLLQFSDFVQTGGTAGWQRASHAFEVAPEARVVTVRAGLFQAEGTLWLDAFTLVEGERPAEFAAVREVDETPAVVPGLQRSDRGNVALYRDDIPPSGAPSDPVALADALRRAGFGVAFLDSAQLADAAVLNRATFDVVVLPYGASFPANAAGNFRRFLRRGGKFVSTGGYTFDNLLEKRDGRWQKPAPPRAPDVDDARWRCAFPAKELRGRGVLTFTGRMRCLNVGGEGFAFLAVYQYGAGSKIVAWKDVCHLTGSQGWGEHRYEFEVHPDAERVEVQAGLYRCRGVAWAEDLRLTDEAGRVVPAPDFTQPGAAGAPAWQPSSPERCSVDPKGGSAGGAALKVRLGYFQAGEERLNTRHGRPADGLDVAPTQLGVFQADCRLERAVALRPAAEQCAFVKCSDEHFGLEGWAAVGAAGFNQARWQPLLQAMDRYGRNRGAAGALLRHYSGTYAGSSWAYFGVSNRDLFAPGQGVGPEGFVALVADLVRDTYLARVLGDPACARPGEETAIRATVYNGGRRERAVRVAFTVLPETGERAVHQAEVVVTAAAGANAEAAIRWEPPTTGAGYYRVRCELREDRRAIDRLEGGLVVWRPEVVARGPKLSFQGNYLRLDGTPRFLFGTDDWSYVFNQDRETPAQWRFDAAQRRDYGVQIYENLQVGMPPEGKARDDFLRKCDGVVQLAQKHRQVYFAGLLIGANVAADDAELARQTEWCREFARRYRDVPGIIYYLNGDLRCEITERVTPHWNEFLRERYGSDAALRAAWGRPSPPGPLSHAAGEGEPGAPLLGRIPASEYQGDDWSDVRAFDTNLFRAWLIRRWTGALIRAIRAEDPDALTSCEFYQLPHYGVDIPEGIGDLDLSNIGFFDRPLDDVRRFPALLKYSDQRARGKSLGPGEYGVKLHPAWGDGKDYGYHITRTPQQALDTFFAVPHYSLGLGASRIHNWCWKDCTHRVFPWGMVYPGDGVPKEILLAHRAQSILFRQLAPVYREPEVYVVTADAHRLGGQKMRVAQGILRGIDLALGAHVENPGVLNERQIAAGGAIPASAKVLFYPLPYCPSVAAYEKLLAWVRAGGTLYLSGDLSYDEQRGRTQTRRLEELCGARFLGERYPQIDYGERPAVALTGSGGWRFSPGHPGLRLEAASARVLATDPEGSPVAFLNQVGKGRVVFLAEPLELHAEAETRAVNAGVYRQVLRLAGGSPLPITPDDPFLHVFRVPLQDGGSAWVLFNADESREAREVALDVGKETLTFTLAKQRPGLAWVDGAGRLRALEASSRVRAGDRVLLECPGQTILFSADGEDLRRSRALVALPLAPGALRVPAGSWSAPAAEVGEAREGAWRRYEDLPARVQGGVASVDVSPDAAGSVVLIGERARLGAAAQAVQALVGL